MQVNEKENVVNILKFKTNNMQKKIKFWPFLLIFIKFNRKTVPTFNMLLCPNPLNSNQIKHIFMLH